MKNNFHVFSFTTVSHTDFLTDGVPSHFAERMNQRVRIDLSRVESYAEAIPEPLPYKEESLVATEVIMYSGTNMLLNIPYDEFDKKFKEFVVSSTI